MKTLPVLQTSLTKSLVTCCPNCRSFLGVGAEELRAGDGKGRCVACSTPFDILPEVVEVGTSNPQVYFTCPVCYAGSPGPGNSVRMIATDELRRNNGQVKCNVCSTMLTVSVDPPETATHSSVAQPSSPAGFISISAGDPDSQDVEPETGRKPRRSWLS